MTTTTNNNNNNNNNNKSSSSLPGALPPLLQSLLAVIFLQFLYTISLQAYQIRLYALNEFGRVIHEFDPYFNYRATVYLYENGWQAFSKWFDYMVWYPLGRPVGTTIYPGMQVTAVAIKNYVLHDWSINDICCFVPAWFGVLATLAVAWMTWEATNGRQSCVLQSVPLVNVLYQKLIQPTVTTMLSHYVEPAVGGMAACGLRSQQCFWWTPVSCAVAAAAIMSIVPAHLLRSIGGGYDNESIAMTAMVVTFASWMMTLRDDNDNNNSNVLLKATAGGVLTGLAYFYMVAAWGGYVFVLNLIGVHAAVLVLLGRYSSKLYRAYTAFYVVGTSLATRVPVVGWTPIKSLEQMGPLLVFAGMQLIQFCEIRKRQQNLSTKQTWILRIKVFALAGLLAAVVAYVLVGYGYFGPISSRVRGLFVKHTKTGNPLVDSVAEHQAANKQAYWQYLHDVCYLIPLGLGFVLLTGWNDSSSFLLVYGVAAYYFSLRMVRLILLTAPIASALGGIAIGRIVSWGAISPLLNWEETPKLVSPNSSTKKSVGKKIIKNKSPSDEQETQSVVSTLSLVTRACRLIATAVLVFQAKPYAQEFYKMSHEMAKAISHPTIIQKARTHSGETVLLDDYREAYNWLAHNTPEDARIMAWWDYGYQITGIGNRTTIADGNTWNHEHIALLGRILTGPEKEAHRIARHLADYVLVWAGGGGDDLAKSPHLRRIANSVYRGLCREPTCGDFGFQSDHTPTDSLRGSLLYTLHSHKLSPGVEADRNRFREVFKSKYGKVRIFKILSVSKESKEWVEQNRVCDAPGSWYCPGQYPPALTKILKEKRDFAQLEDFNRGAADAEYTKEYFENLNKKKTGPDTPPAKKKIERIPESEIEKLNEDWKDTEITSALWEAISKDSMTTLRDLLVDHPSAAHFRSADGRGPMWWAHEFGRTKIINMLKKLGVSESRTDASGKTPLDVSKA